MAEPDTSAPSSPDSGNGNNGSGVRKISKIPLIIILTVLTAFIVVTIWSVNRKKSPPPEPEEEVIQQVSERNLNADNSPERIREALDYGIQAPEREPDNVPQITQIPSETGNTIPVAGMEGGIPESVRAIPADDPVMKMEADPRIEDYMRLRTQRFRQALDAPLRTNDLNIAKNSQEYRKNTAMMPQKPGPDASYEEKMAYYNKMQALIRQKQGASSYEEKMKIAKEMLGVEGSGSPASGSAVTAKNEGGPAGSSLSGWQLQEAVQPSKGVLTLSTGFVIPAVMIGGVNSDLPNSIIGQVSLNVFDSLTGRNLLIPQGTRLFGTYASQIKFGQERVFVVWNRLVFPNGQTLDLEKMPGSDVSGYAGFSDQVNDHYWKLLKHAFMLSLVSGAVSYSEYHYDKNDESAGSAMAESVGQQMGATTTNVIQKHMDIQPTLEIRNGYRFNIIVNKDITFPRPYRR